MRLGHRVLFRAVPQRPLQIGLVSDNIFRIIEQEGRAKHGPAFFADMSHETRC